MTLKELVLESMKVKNIIVKAVETGHINEIKKDDIWLVNPNDLLKRKVKTSMRVGNEKMIIEVYLYR